MHRPRFSIRWLMMAVVIAAGFSWVYASVTYPSSILMAMGCLSVPAGLAVGPWTILRKDRRLAALVLGVSSVPLAIALAGLGVFTLHFLAVVYRLMVALVFLPFVFGAGVAWAGLASSPDAERRRGPIAAWSLVAALFILPVSMMFSDWPMWVAFAASRPALDRLADRIDAGETLARPEWAGLFLVRKVRPSIQPGTVVLVVENDSTGHNWLVRAPSPEVTPEVPRPTYSVISTIDRILRGGRWWRFEYD